MKLTTARLREVPTYFRRQAPFPLALGGGTITETVNVQDHIVRVGLNYRFGGGYVVAKY
jgi:hypothetical protein